MKFPAPLPLAAITGLRRQAWVAALLGLTALVLANSATAQEALRLSIRGHSLRAEVASTADARSIGLMYRKSLPENEGMLFVFPEAAYHGMWMKNTYVPLSVAFIDRQGAILNIADMAPLSETSHTAAGLAGYALEMNRGWFAKQGIRPGDRIEGLEKAPRGR